MTAHSPTVAPVPRYVSILNPLARRLLAAGFGLGPNALLTVRGRKSGAPRTTPVAIIEDAGRRWIWSPWGDVHWVQNLRSAGRATITVRRQVEDVVAVELDRDAREAFFRDVLGSVTRRIPFGVQFVRLVDGVDLARPEEIAEGRRVFELLANEVR